MVIGCSILVSCVLCYCCHPVNIIGDSRDIALAGYNPFLLFSFSLVAGILLARNMAGSWSHRSSLCVSYTVYLQFVAHPPPIGACTFLSVPDAFPNSSLAVPDYTPSCSRSCPPSLHFIQSSNHLQQHPQRKKGRSALAFRMRTRPVRPETTMGLNWIQWR